MILAAVDPGKVSGIAVWWSPETFDLRGPADTPVDTAEVAAAFTVSTLRRMLDGHKPRLIAVERYRQNARKTHQPQAYEVTGAVRAFAVELGVPCVYQSPAPAQRIGSAARLRQLGWYVSTRDGHANAASGHVLLSMASNYPETYAELIGI